MQDVLVVDEGPVMRRILRLSLQEAGFSVRFARNETDARRQMSAQLPDVLIADIDMPSTDGPALSHWVDETWPSRAFPIVFITARASAVDHPWLESNNTMLLEKPFSVRRLIEELGQRLGPAATTSEVPCDGANAGSN